MSKHDHANCQQEAQSEVNEIQMQGARLLLMGVVGIVGQLIGCWIIGTYDILPVSLTVTLIMMIFLGFIASLSFWEAHALAQAIAEENDWRWTGWKFVDKKVKPTTNWEDAVP